MKQEFVVEGWDEGGRQVSVERRFAPPPEGNLLVVELKGALS